MDEYDFAEFNRVKKESEVIDNQLLCDIANKYNVKSIYGFTTSTLFYGAHKNREIYLQIDPFRYLDCYGYNTWIWDVKNVFEMMALTFLHEIGHCYNGDSGDNRNIEERPKNMWDKLKDGEAWRFAFDYRQKNNENYERMVSQFKEMKNNKPLHIFLVLSTLGVLSFVVLNRIFNGYFFEQIFFGLTGDTLYDFFVFLNQNSTSSAAFVTGSNPPLVRFIFRFSCLKTKSNFTPRSHW